MTIWGSIMVLFGILNVDDDDEAKATHERSTLNASDDGSKVEAPSRVGFGSGVGGGSRAGLFRTPISGGVRSATSAHGLPPPALAVRNLMEQARFAHLCTVMARLHHRRQGYPFGSPVDFSPDSMVYGRSLDGPGLSNARVTIFGDVYPLPDSQQKWAHEQYIAKHHQGRPQQWGNFYYFRVQNIRFKHYKNLCKIFDKDECEELLANDVEEFGEVGDGSDE
ncbi:hypothetical protein AKJ16_DCAP04589, partial [Drosera capensis]